MNIPKGGISCERGANNEEPVSVFDDAITFFSRSVNLTFFVLKKEYTGKKKKEKLPALWRKGVKLTCDP